MADKSFGGYPFRIHPRPSGRGILRRRVKMGGKKKIGIKYCGGCNPSYERVELTRRVQALVEDRFLFLGCDEEDLNALVLVNGCPRACADDDLDHQGPPSHSIIGETDFESLLDWLGALDGE